VNDDLLRAVYAEVLARRAAARDDCINPDALLALADGTAAEPERLALLGHIGACPHCRRELDLLRAAGDAAGYAAQRSPRMPLLAAAVIVLLAGSAALWQARRPPATDTLRQGPTAEVRLLEPTGTVRGDAPLRLVWTAMRAARRYDVEVLRPDGSPAFAVSLRDTSLTIPASAGLAPGIDYQWWVRAVLEDGGELRSRMAPLRIGER
jgi:hypothetical protein